MDASTSWAMTAAWSPTTPARTLGRLCFLKHPSSRLVGGVGERLETLPHPAPFGVVLIPFTPGLRAGEVYAEADRMGLGRSAAELEEVAGKIRRAAAEGASPFEYSDLLVNDLEEAAVSLRPASSERRAR